MKTPKFFELIASSKEKPSDPRFRIFVELGDKDKDFWESQALGTAEGRAQMTALRTGLTEVLPNKTELSEAPVATFFEDDVEAIIAKAEPIIAKDGQERGSLKTDPRRKPYRVGYVIRCKSLNRDRWTGLRRSLQPMDSVRRNPVLDERVVEVRQHVLIGGNKTAGSQDH